MDTNAQLGFLSLQCREIEALMKTQRNPLELRQLWDRLQTVRASLYELEKRGVNPDRVRLQK
jgi:hypothetical protein